MSWEGKGSWPANSNAHKISRTLALAHSVYSQVEIDPSTAIYQAQEVEVKTGEEEEETVFTLEKAKLFEYHKSEDEAEVG